MSFVIWLRRPAALLLLITLASLGAASASAQTAAQTPPWPGDLSAAGLRAAASISDNPAEFDAFLPEPVVDAVRDFVRQTRGMGMVSRSGHLSVAVSAPLNVRANDPFAVPDRVGETQAEVAVAVFRDTVVVGFNDSRGFTLTGSPGVGTLSGFAYSTDGGATFTDGGTTPVALASDFCNGDPGVDTDEQGNWYYNQIYTRAAGAPGPTAQQNIGVHHGRFNGSGQLVWDLPVQCSVGTSATGVLDKCLLACDRLTGNVYVAYTRFTAVSQIEVVRSTTLGTAWDAPIVLDNTTTPTSSKQGARPFCGPGGEVYVVWEKGANTINCPDGSGNLTNTTGTVGFARSLDFGVTYGPFAQIGTVNHSWTWSGPGDLRERGNEFPDIAVDRSGSPYNGRIYVTWHESAPWTANLSAGPPRAEAADAANNNPGAAELFVAGEDVTGSISSTSDFDYWRFDAVQGQGYLFNLDPSTFNCGVSGTSAGMRLRLFATQSPYPVPTGFPDSLLAASALGTFADRITWTCPKTGSYVIRLQRTAGTTPYTYRLRVRPLAFGAPDAARDARDVVVISSADQGLTWSPERLVNDDPAGLENRRPFMACDALGHVHAFWHDSRTPGFGSNAALASIYGTTSRDGGASWTPNYPVTDELSFFSFNTVAVPNLGDYNMAAGGSDFVIAAWSDQRLSTGDVRNTTSPFTPSFLAGLGPEAYTARVQFAFALTCPPTQSPVTGGTSLPLAFCVTNQGTVPDSYGYNLSDPNGWLVGGPLSGTVGPLDPGQTACVSVVLNLPLDCMPSSADTIAFSVVPVGDPYGGQSCGTVVGCEAPVAALVATFGAQAAGDGVDLLWSSFASDIVRGWNIYRGLALDDTYVRLNAEPIAMGAGGAFRYHDSPGAAGTLYYRLAGVMGDGHERQLETIAFTAGAGPRSFSFAMAGPNPFRTGTSFTYSLPERTPVRVEVFNLSGKRLATLVDRIDEPGVYNVPFHADAVAGGLAAGVYQVRITAGGYARTIQAIALQ
jgi:hypothetical protein